MKVLFLTNIPSPYRIDYFNELGKLCDLTVIYERKSANNRDKKWINKTNKINYKEIYLKSIKIGNESSLSVEQITILKKEKFDVIVISGYSSLTAMITISYLSINKIPFIMSCDGGLISNDNKIKYMLKTFFIKKARMWLSTGDETTKYLVHYGAKKEDIRVYPFTSVRNQDICKEKINKDYYKTKLGLKEKKVVISIGQFIYRKGFDLLIKASDEIDDDIGIYIIGGEITEEYKKIMERSCKSNIHFLNFMPKDELSDYYKAADLFILPTREDIWGLVINEAMAYGLPIITTDKCVAGKELVKNDFNGYIIKANSYKDIPIKINSILSNDELMKKMSTNSLKLISNYTIEEMANSNYKYFLEFDKIHNIN